MTKHDNHLPNELGFSASMISDVSEIDAKQWNACTDGNPFLNHDFFLALEQSKSASNETGWQPLHLQLTVKKTGELAGIIPLYLKNHSYGEYVFDHAWANAFEAAGGRYYPKLQSSVPFTPVTGSRLLIAPNAPAETNTMLLETAKSFVAQHHFSSLHMTFLPQTEARLAEKSGYLIRTDQQFHWQNKGYRSFNDFLGELSSRKRKQIKKERRLALSTGVKIKTLDESDIESHHWDAFFRFYLDTSAKKWGQPYLNREFFDLIGASMPKNIVLMLCEYEGKFVAGALNFKNQDTLYGRYWGSTIEIPCLHFETCYYQAIEYAIEHGLKTVEAGAQGPHKLARGYVPTHTYSAHWIENEGFRNAVASFLNQERKNIDAEIEYLSNRTPFKT